MVSNRSILFACLLGLIATSQAYPAQRSESAVETTVRSQNDDIGDEAAATATTEQVVLADEAVPATTELNVVLKSENVEQNNNVIAVEEVVVPVENKQATPLVVAEVVGDKSAPVIEVVEIVPVENVKSVESSGGAAAVAAVAPAAVNPPVSNNNQASGAPLPVPQNPGTITTQTRTQ